MTCTALTQFDPDDHRSSDTHISGVVGVPQLHPDQPYLDTHCPCVGVDPSAVTDQAALDTHAADVGDSTSLDPDHHTRETHCASVGVDPSPPAAANKESTPIISTPRREDTVILILADLVDDYEDLRKRTANRLRSLDQVKGYKDEGLEDQLAGQQALEDAAVKQLTKAMRTHPLGPWVRANKGLGEKTIARLLASIGDPYWNDKHGRPRTKSELWSFSGYRPGQRRVKGQRSNWSPTAKMRAYLCAESAIKAGVRKLDTCDDTNGYDVDGRVGLSAYGQRYLDGRRKYTHSVHAEPCVRCGPSGKPAEAGSPLSPAHQHARAVRLVTKDILHDLWVEARRIRNEDAR